jgi:hypothetical protein
LDAVRAAPAFNHARATTIAQNETTRAEREGLGLAMRNIEVAQGKVWRTMEDLKVEPDCRENAAVGVIGLEDEWPHGEYPHIGCCCWCELSDLDEGEE